MDTGTWKLQELIGCSYLGKEEEDGTRIRRHIVRLIEEHDEATDKLWHKFLVENHREDALDKLEEIITYDEILEFLNQEIDRDLLEQYW